MKRITRYQWFVFGVFFVFMLLHQTDRFLISSVTTQIMDTFKITMTQMGAVSTGALIVGAVMYPVWGYLYDRFARSKLLALASLIWGSTTWLNAVAPNYSAFLVTRATTGIDDSSYPGLWSLMSDYFSPNIRGKIYGFLQLTSPLGFMLGMFLGVLLGDKIGWRNVFYITGSLGIVVAVVIFFTVREAPRGGSEPEMQGLENTTEYPFSMRAAGDLFKKPTYWLIFLQGFFGVFPWNAITFWFFVYLEKERGYSSGSVLATMVPAVLVLAAGYPLGGALGDSLFKRTPRGRLIVSLIGVAMGAVLLYFTLNVPLQQQTVFMVMLMLTALFIPFASANVISTVFDISLPEIRSTASAVENFIESIGAALSPVIVGAIADAYSLKDAFLIICLSTWALCVLFFLGAAYLVPKDIHSLRAEMKIRAEKEKASQGINATGASNQEAGIQPAE